MVKIFKNVVCLFVVLAASVVMHAQNKTAARPAALQLLKTREPAVKWNRQSLVKGDFDYDNVFDYALTGTKGDLFVVGIVKGRLSRKSKHWTLEFSVGSAHQNSLCSAVSAEINLETFAADDELEELRKVPKNSRGINLSDGLCDAFRIYYSQNERQFVWRRN